MSAKCSAGNCAQAPFREGFCIDHYRSQTVGKGAKKMVVPDGKEENIDEAMRNKFKEVTKKAYIDQGKWYLNTFWSEGGESQAEEVWTTVHKFIELDPKKKSGNELNEVQAHHYLQSLGKTMTALELPNELRRIDVDANGQMALVEYLLFYFKKLVSTCLNNSQGTMDEKENKLLQEAQTKCDALQKSLEQLTAQIAVQRAAEEEAKTAAAELHRQEEDFKNKVSTLEKKSSDSTQGIVVRNKASQELAQLKSQDPLPLRKAKITQDACVRRVSEETRKVEAAQVDCEKRFKEAQEFLEEMKKKAGAPQGALWWMQREVTEARKYMPKSKQ